jgi:hypothetical protein
VNKRFTEEYCDWLRKQARIYGFDGCTFASELYQVACYEHDFHFRFGCDRWGDPVTRADADRMLREAVQELSPLGKFSPVSWLRWMATRAFSWKAWNKHRNASR